MLHEPEPAIAAVLAICENADEIAQMLGFSSIEEVKEYCKERNNGINAETFIDFYESKGWKVGKTPMKDWKAAVRNWERNRRVKVETKVPDWFDKKIESEEIDDETRRLIEEIEGA